MNGDPLTHGLWEKTAPPAPPTVRLEGDVECDVAIVGAGFTGLSAALHAAEGGATAVVLDGAEIGFGGSGRNVGLVNAGMWVMPDELPRVLGEKHGDALLKLLGDAPRAVFDLVDKHRIACEAERSGTLHCAVGARGLAELEQRERQWRARGAPVRLLGKAEAAAKIGTNAYAGALLDQRAGTIQPLAYARGLAAAAIAAGARIFSSSPVVDCAADGDRWIVRTPHGAARARWVIVATNAYTDTPWAELRAELTHLPYFNFATVPLDAAARRAILPERQGPGRPAGVRQRRRVARNRPVGPPRLGAPRARQDFPPARRRRLRGRVVRHDRHDRRSPAALPPPGAQRRRVQRLQRPRHRAGDGVRPLPRRPRPGSDRRGRSAAAGQPAENGALAPCL